MIQNKPLSFVILLGVGALAVACSSEKPAAAEAPPAQAPQAAAAEAAPAAGAAVDAAATEEAKKVFATRCTPCHGATGAGDGPGSSALSPKPANFTSAEWQAKVTDEHIEKIIAYGGSAVGKSAAMPSNPDLDGKPVIPALRAHIRSLKAK